MVVGLLFVSFLFSLFAAVMAGILGASFVDMIAVYVGCGTLMGVGLGIFVVIASKIAAARSIVALEKQADPAVPVSP